MKEIKSSAIQGVERRGDNLRVTFRSGACYEYEGCGEQEDALLDADSPGRYFSQNINGKFATTRVHEDE